MSLKELQEIISKKFTSQVLEDIIKNGSQLDEEIKVKAINIDTSSAKKGDAYISQICRFIVTASGINKKYQKEEISIPVIVKFLPKNQARRKTFRCSVFFENEANFYTKVWPHFQKFQASKNFSENFDNIPLLLSSHIDSENDFIALLDLSPQGYQSLSRGVDLNLTQTLTFLKLLANFHALSLAFRDQKPQDFENVVKSLDETYFHEKYRSWFRGHLKNLILVATDAIQKELPEEYLIKFKNFLEKDIYQYICDGCKVRGPLAVVNHGDLWAPNFLIRYSEGNKIDTTMMIDFQLARYTTLSADLTFFLFTCVDVQLLEHNWNLLISCYHDTLTQSLENLGSSQTLLSLNTIHGDLRNIMNFGVGVAIENIIMSLLDDEQVEDLDLFQGDEAVPLTDLWKVQPFKDKAKRERFANFVKFVIDHNFI